MAVESSLVFKMVAENSADIHIAKLVENSADVAKLVENSADIAKLVENSAEIAKLVENEIAETGEFYERFAALPVVTEAINTTSSVYNTLKNQHPLTQYACDTGESIVKKVTQTAYNVGSPIASMALNVAKPLVGDPVSRLDHVAAETLAKCEEKFPIITKPPSEILDTTVGTIKEKAGDCYQVVNNTRIAQFTNARIKDVISISEMAVEVLLPSDASSEEDVKEEKQEALAIQKNVEAKESKGNFERVVTLGKRINRRASKKLMDLKPVQFTYDSMISIQTQMTSLVTRSKDTGHAVQEACLVIPNLAIKLTGEVAVSTKAFVIAFTDAYSIKDIPGSVASVSGKVVKPVTDATGRVVAQLLLPPKLVMQYILSSNPIQCLIPNVVVFEEISKMTIEVDDLADSDNDDADDDDDDDDDDDEHHHEIDLNYAVAKFETYR